MKNVLVTGATGFIASHLLPVLHQQNWQIKAAVRHDSSKLPKIAIKAITVGEIDDNTNWQEAVLGVDTIIHLAARAHILQNNIANSEKEFFRVNTDGTINLVRQAMDAGVKHFVFISSIGAMATLSEEILNENSPCQPDTPYGKSKLQAELALENLTKNSQMTWTILRPTLVYGPGNPGNMERLIKLVKQGLPLPFAAVNNRRSFLFVGNLVSAIANVIDNPQSANQIFLVSDGQNISTPNLISQIALEMEQPCKMLAVAPRFLKLLGYCGDGVEYLSKKTFPINTSTIERIVGSLFVDSSYIEKTLNWHPPFTIEQGIKKTIKL